MRIGISRLLAAGLATGLAGGLAGGAGPAGATPTPAAVAAADFSCSVAGDGPAPDGVAAGTLSAPFPTQRGITLDWAVGGDADGDATAAVRYRKAGESGWTEGLPLRRVPSGSNEGFSWSNRVSGSLFDTAPGTTYDVELELTDPDGGCAVRSLSVTTPRVPTVPGDGRVRRTGPGRLQRILDTAAPGDIIELKAGTYRGFSVARDGTADHPIVLRRASGTRPGRVVVNGEIGLYDRRYVQLRGLVVHGRIRANGSTAVAIVGNRISGDPEGGIQAVLHSRRAYIAHNVVRGPTRWRSRSVGADGDNTGEGIVVTGPGHVIERNTASGWRDCLSTMEDGEAWQQFSIDIRANRLTHCADDAIEADFCFHNCRVVDNLILSSFVAMSSQPGLGGPTYFLRNRAYGILYAPFKLYRGSVGDVLLFNTVVKHGDALNVYSGVRHRRQYSRNNLFLGGPGGTYGGYSGGTGLVMSLAYDRGGSYDYDGFGTAARRFRGVFRDRHFSGLAGLRERTTEKHGVRVGFGIFATRMRYPDRAFAAYAVPDFTLRPGSSATAAGIFLPGLGLPTGARPDLGAVQLGSRPAPVGARPR
jgi:hypothetical protein